VLAEKVLVFRAPNQLAVMQPHGHHATAPLLLRLLKKQLYF
jgi:hypothetical protein